MHLIELIMNIVLQLAFFLFYGPHSHPYNCFPQGLMYVYNIYIYVCVTYASMRLCIVKEVVSSRGLGQLMGVWCKRTCARATNLEEDSGRMQNC